ncbi:MAG: Flp pilus assembly protein CpaB [Alphaproteobacteria bacterium]|nr:Flp pilus assembly protein CpaB [Alphaproteobacteria bacterium]
MKFKDIIGLILALFLAIAVAFLIRYFLAEKESTKETPAAQVVKNLKILVASKPLDMGIKVQPGDLVWQSWPNNSLNDNYIQEGAIQLDGLNGSVILEHIDKGEPVTIANLVQPGEKSILAALLPPGKRAISIDVTPQAISSGLIHPGDYVDVLLSKTITSTGTQQYGQTTAVVNNIKVLALDMIMGESIQKQNSTTSIPNSTTSIPKVATLEVTPSQAELITAAAKEGSLSLSLHGLSNKKVVTEEDPLTGVVTLMRGKEKTEVQVSKKK